VKLWNIPELTEAATLTGYLLGTHSVAFSPTGRRLAAGSGGVEAVKIWDLETGQEVLTLEGQGSIFGHTLFSPDGRTLASRNGDGMLHLYRAPTWDEIEQREKGQAAPMAR
jgi:WD40 repeat protein